ncbi:MAG TPA: hypothetical protein VLH86_05165 [Patescibacteria group bacterium]|nr:hypothetical protein [Patescibacteria group bacterium]
MSRKTIIKLGSVFAILYGLWKLWENDAAVNALVVFCTAGVVPFSHIVLTPDQVYFVLASIMFLAVVGIFWKQWFRAARTLRSLWRKTAVEAIADATPLVAASDASATAASVAGPKTRARKRPAPKAPIVITLAPQPGHLLRFWRAVRPRLLMAVGATLETVINSLQRMAVMLSRASLEAYRYSVRAWLTVEPYLRRFDKWLEHTLKSNKDMAAVLHVWSEFLKSANARILVLRAYFGRLPRTPEE